MKEERSFFKEPAVQLVIVGVLGLVSLIVGFNFGNETIMLYGEEILALSSAFVIMGSIWETAKAVVLYKNGETLVTKTNL